MKQIKTIILPILFAALISTVGLITSCEDYLDQPPSATMPIDTVFSNIANAERVLATAYALMPYGFPAVQVGAWSYALQIYFSPVSNISDESENAWPSAFHNSYYNDGKLDPTVIYPFLEDKWLFNFEAIRSAYLFIENVDKIPEPRPSQEYINRLKAEARAIIGIKYFEMFKRYGGMPWMNKVYSPNDKVDFTRLTVAQTVDSIAAVLDLAARDLPARFDGPDFARVNKVTVLATKARLYLYAASPLFNAAEPYVPYGKIQNIAYGNVDVNRWKKAADAAKAAIDLAESNGFRLVNTGNPEVDYTTAVKSFPPENTEIIHGSRNLKSIYDQQGAGRWKPYSKKNFTGGTPCLMPMQNAVDLYETIDGKPTTPDFFNQTNPYEKGKLDPRFHQTVLYHGSKFDIYTMDMSQSPSGVSIGDNHSRPSGQFYTGYYCLKFQFPEFYRIGGATPHSFWPYLRLSDLYLMYAEALNESEPNNPDIKKYINLIRKRAGIAELPVLPSDNTQAGMRNRIINERAVELMFEGHRYFDLKRWKMGHVLAAPVYGMNTVVDGSTTRFERFKFEDRAFPAHLYLYPFPLDDVLRSPGLLQNPGY
jgi:starch-binding outer membrane protein, SusD/RagB family